MHNDLRYQEYNLLALLHFRHKLLYSLVISVLLTVHLEAHPLRDGTVVVARPSLANRLNSRINLVIDQFERFFSTILFPISSAYSFWSIVGVTHRAVSI